MVTRAVLYQDSAQAVRPDSTTASAVPVSLPEMRTPDNGGYMQIAYVIAAVIYAGYLLVLRGRWTALRKRQTNNATKPRR